MQSQLLTIYGRVDRAALLANFERIWKLSAVRNRFLIKGLDVWFLHPHSEKREVPRGHRFSRGTRWDAVRHPMFFTCLWDAKSVPHSSSQVGGNDRWAYRWMSARSRTGTRKRPVRHDVNY